ncbi:MAG: sulfotransferase [Caulobacteraceae bacterium]|nr:sulfotransferase [Caulobacteraceae bacterium]
MQDRSSLGSPLGFALEPIDRLLQARRGAEALGLIAGLPLAQRRDPRIGARAAYAHALLGQAAEALRVAGAVRPGLDRDPVGLGLIGNALVLCQQAAAAHEAFSRAGALAPGDMDLLFNLATTARFVGRQDEAQAAYDRIIAAAPQTWAAWRNRSELRTQTAASNHIAQMERALRDLRPPWPGEVQLCYALGKECEDLGLYDQAFSYFQRGGAVRRGHMRYDLEDDIQTLSLIGQHFDAAYCAPARSRTEGAGPIFVLGLPRTGSTLLERMLGRRPDIQPLGELQMFAGALVSTTRRLARTPIAGKADLIRASAAVDPLEIGAKYLESVTSLRDARPYFIDKLPINYLYAGAIARALPTATIIHVQRQPRDVCVAIFKTLFDEAYPFSYDLGELGRYHNAYRALMAHWRAALGPRFIEVAYEDLVREPQAALSGVFGALGLRPDADGEADGDAPVMTASASQVRQPVHQKSVSSAERYAGHLGLLLEVLEQPEVRA